MSEISKYENLIKDLSSVETQASIIRNKYKDTLDRNKEVEGKLSKLKKENIDLLQKVSKLEKEIEEKETNILNSLNLKERETLKIKLQSLLSKIDYHLSADRHV